MDAVLTTVTIISLAAAAGFGTLAWRTWHLDRRRSEARVAALASAISADPATSADPDRRPVAVAPMFQTAPGAAVRGRPLLKAAVVATLAVTAIVITAMANGGQTEPASPQPAAPLELVSMRHTKDHGTLTVAGLVRNPSSGVPMTRIAAVVFAFDHDGNFLSSGKAGLDFTALEPGDESPFVVAVTVPDASEISRYRVSFRTEAGMLKHVDRRGKETQFDFSEHRAVKSEKSNRVS